MAREQKQGTNVGNGSAEGVAERPSPIKRPFGNRSRSISDIVGSDGTNAAPSELGQSFIRATQVAKVADAERPRESAVSPAPGTTTAAPPQSNNAAMLPPNAGSQAKDEGVAEAAQGPAEISLPIAQVVENPRLQPRLRISEDHVIELSEKFKQAGQYNAILVRPVDGAPGTYEVIGGNHRLRAAQRLGWSHIRAKILQVSFDEARVIAIDDNDSNLPTSDYEKAIAYQGLLDDGVVTSHAALAERFGVSKARITQCLSFMALPPSVRDVLNDHPELFSYRTAVELRKLIGQHSTESGPAPNVLEHVTAGVMRLVDGAPLSSLTHWIEQRISGKMPFRSASEPRIVLDPEGRTAFKTKGKDNAVMIEWDKKTNTYSPDVVQEAVMQALKTLAETRGRESAEG